MATVNIGNIKFTWQGAYNGSSSYAVDDIVSYNGSSYVCILASTGNLPTNTTYWNVMSQKGTDGTDITTISGLAQGDILYYNGTDWVRLGAGTSGQVLQTGGTGANPSWTTMSSDVVKLADFSIGSNTNTASIDGYFTSDYKVYEYVIHDFRAPSWLKTRFNVGGTAQTGSDYSCFMDYVKQGGSSGHGTWGTNNDTAFYGPTYWSTNSNPYGYFRMILIDPLNTSRYKIMYMPEQYEMHNTTMYMSDGGGRWAGNSALSGVTFFVENGNNFTLLKGALYGYKQNN